MSTLNYQRDLRKDLIPGGAERELLSICERNQGLAADQPPSTQARQAPSADECSAEGRAAFLGPSRPAQKDPDTRPTPRAQTGSLWGQEVRHQDWILDEDTLFPCMGALTGDADTQVA